MSQDPARDFNAIDEEQLKAVKAKMDLEFEKKRIAQGARVLTPLPLAPTFLQAFWPQLFPLRSTSPRFPRPSPSASAPSPTAHPLEASRGTRTGCTASTWRCRPPPRRRGGTTRRTDRPTHPLHSIIAPCPPPSGVFLLYPRLPCLLPPLPQCTSRTNPAPCPLPRPRWGMRRRFGPRRVPLVGGPSK